MEKATIVPKRLVPIRKKIITWISLVAIGIIYLWTFVTIQVDWSIFFSDRLSDNFNRIIPKLLSPDFGTLQKVLLAMLETLNIAFVGSLMAAIFAVPLGFLAANNVVKSKTLNTIGKWILDAIRAFPDLILAIIFVAAIGPAPFAGVLAIAFGSTGMLGKLYSEVIESIDMHVVEALEASGANKVQLFIYGILPQVLPEFMSYAMYRFEIDVRASTILGIVGAGGIGTLVTISTMQRDWSAVGMILLVIIVVVTIIDTFSSRVRGKLV